MSKRPRLLAFSLSLLPACHDASPPEAAPEGIACPLTERVRLASPPGDFEPGNFFYSLHRLGDHLLFSFERADGDERIFWHTSRCGGPVEEYTTLPAGLLPYQAIAVDDAPILYAIDHTGQVFVADRFVSPEFDAPRPVTGLPSIEPGLPVLAASPRGYATFSVVIHSSLVGPAAGIGGSIHARYAHTGDPDVPALELGAATVSAALFDDHVFILDDDGALRRIDPSTGAGETLQTGVRYMTVSPDGRKLIWQELGDDKTESVYLRDLATGIDLGIAVNDFAARSWGRNPTDPSAPSIGLDAGLWSWTGDGAYAAQIGPEGTAVAAVRTDTGETLPIPSHTDLRFALVSHFMLDLGDEAEHVSAIWNPATGDVIEWHRGPVRPALKRYDATSAEFLLRESEDPYSDGSLVRVDLATGTTTERLPRFSLSSFSLDEDLYLYAARSQTVSIPSFDDGMWETNSYNLAFADPATRLYTPIADDVTALAIVPDEALYILDAHGEDPGVWAVPYPK